MHNKKSVFTALLTTTAIAVIATGLIVGDVHSAYGEVLCVGMALATVYLLMSAEALMAARPSWAGKVPNAAALFLCLFLLAIELSNGHWILVGFAMAILSLVAAPEATRKRILGRFARTTHSS